MEKFINKESEQKVNFFNEKLDFSLSINKEAVNFLPEVSENDIKTKKEKFCFLLGDFHITDQNKIEISIDAVLESEPKENLYKEGIEEVHSIDTPSAIKMVEKMQKMPEFKNKNYKLIGDIHTHPCKPSEFEKDFIPWVPSEGDIESIIENYKKNVLKDNSPYIFGIAAPNENGETLYAYYRIIKNGDIYSYVKI